MGTITLKTAVLYHTEKVLEMCGHIYVLLRPLLFFPAHIRLNVFHPIHILHINKVSHMT